MLIKRQNQVTTRLNLRFEVRPDQTALGRQFDWRLVRRRDRESSTMERSAEEMNAALSAQLQDISANAEAAVDEVLLDEALYLVEQHLDSEVPVANSAQCIGMLQSLVVIGYKRDTLNECTLKAWRLFSRALTVNHLGCHTHDIAEFGSLLRTYCEEGLEALSLNLSSVSTNAEAYLQQELTTIKLLGFFTLRLTEYVQYTSSHPDSQQDSDAIKASCRLLLWYTGILGTIGRYSDSVAPLLAKSLQNFEKLPAERRELSCQLLGCISGTETVADGREDSGFQVTYGAMLTALHLLEAVTTRGGLDVTGESECSYVYLCDTTICIVSETYCGLLGDAEVSEFMYRVVQTLRTVIGIFESPASVAVVLEFVTSMSCSAGDTEENVKRRRGFSAVARQILCGVLASFGTNDQRCLADVVWQHCKHLLACSEASYCCVRDTVSTMRTMLQVVDEDTLCALLPEVLSVGRGTSGLPSAVCEMLLSHLPIAYIVSTGNAATVRMLHAMLEQAVFTVEQYGGSTGELNGRNGGYSGLQIGTAISLLIATAGCYNSNRGSAEALQQDAWRACLDSVKSNVGVGTSLLRWISSLSEHIRTLLCFGAGDVINMARVQRVFDMASDLTALVKCLWSHSVPRAVQQVLVKASRSCLEAATRVLQATSRDATEGRLLSASALQLMEFATAVMKVVAGPTFSEKSLESIRLAYDSWATACIAANKGCSPQQWKYWTIFLASLQQFANALPAPLKPRARELVPSHLVPLIQSRALGRTYSLEQQAEIMLTPADHHRIALHVQAQRNNGVGDSDHFQRLWREATDHNTPTDELGGDSRSSKRPRIAEESRRTVASSVQQHHAWTTFELNTLMRRASDEPGGTLPILQVTLNNGDGDASRRCPMTMAALLLSEQQLCDLGAGGGGCDSLQFGSVQRVSGVTARMRATVNHQHSDHGGDDNFSYTAQSEPVSEIAENVCFALSFESTLTANFTPT